MGKWDELGVGTATGLQVNLPRPTPSGLPDVLSLDFGIGGRGIISTGPAGTALGAVEASLGPSHRFACPPTPEPPPRQAEESATEDSQTPPNKKNPEPQKCNPGYSE